MTCDLAIWSGVYYYSSNLLYLVVFQKQVIFTEFIIALIFANFLSILIFLFSFYCSVKKNIYKCALKSKKINYNL